MNVCHVATRLSLYYNTMLLLLLLLYLMFLCKVSLGHSLALWPVILTANTIDVRTICIAHTYENIQFEMHMFIAMIHGYESIMCSRSYVLPLYIIFIHMDVCQWLFVVIVPCHKSRAVVDQQGNVNQIKIPNTLAFV